MRDRAELVFVSTTLEGEDVAIRAISLAAVAEALLRLLGRMRELALPSVARGAAFGRDFAHRALAHVMTFGAGDLGLDHVHAVAGHRARAQPCLLDVQPAPVGAIARTFTAAARKGDRQHQRQQQRQRIVTTTHQHRPAA